MGDVIGEGLIEVRLFILALLSLWSLLSLMHMKSGARKAFKEDGSRFHTDASAELPRLGVYWCFFR